MSEPSSRERFGESAGRGPGRGEGRRWRGRAWDLVREGRIREGADVLRALISSGLSGGPRAALRDRFRLLRLQLALGDWEEALESVEALYARLARRGILGGVAAGWVFLARAVAQFHLGQGRRFRRSLSTVLRAARHGPSASLRGAAFRLAAAYARLACDPERPPTPRARATLLRAARSVAPAAGGAPGDGTRSPSTWADGIVASLDDLAPCRTGEDGGARDGARPCEAWLAEATSPPTRPPLRLIPAIARLAEERVAEAPSADRLAIHRALSRHAASVDEPWARACLLEALAETALWLPPNGDGTDAGGHLLQARTDLGLAAGLFRRMEWPERAARCEERWARLALPALGPAVSERAVAGCEPTAEAPAAIAAGLPATASSARCPHPARVRAALQEAGFLTGDRRVIEDLAPLLLLAQSPLPVLILGESGTGKEVIARALHRWSRVRGEFVPIHCGAIPRDLLESELFGHARGAFTGASADKPGLIEASGGGTLFLDEIGEMGMEAQMKMLRVLESGEVRRLGELQPRRVSIRLVAATHRDLEAEIAAGRFRLDLFHRIRGVAVRLRPLRERRGDIPVLAARFLSHGGAPVRLSPAALARLLAYDWPGNVRELRSVLLRAAHLARAMGRPTVLPGFLGLGDGMDGSGCALSWGDGDGSGDAARSALEGEGAASVALAGREDLSAGRSADESLGAFGGRWATQAAAAAEPAPARELLSAAERDLRNARRSPGGEGTDIWMPAEVAESVEVGGGLGSAGRGAGLPAPIRARGPTGAPSFLPVEGLDAYLESIERGCILRALEQHGWNRTRAARSLGDMSRTTLLSKMKRLGIAGREDRDGPEGD